MLPFKVLYPLFVLLGLINISMVKCIRPASPRKTESLSYPAINCRKHSALLTDFGGKGDGKTLNTAAFQAAIKNLSQFASDGGAQLIVPPGKWLTGSFNLTSHFTLFLHKDAVILGSQDEKQYPVIAPLPSYGRGRERLGPRFASLIGGSRLTDVVITGNNGTIDGQGSSWWAKMRAQKLVYDRPYLIELMNCIQLQISNITLINSAAWFVHPVYCRDVIVQGLTILAPVDSPNTDGINPDSSSNIKIQDVFIASGDDCVGVKSGWNQYGIKFGMPTKQLIIRRLTCIAPNHEVISLGSELSGGIEDIRAEAISGINCKAAVSIKTLPGRGAFVRNIFVNGMDLHTMKFVFWTSDDFGDNPDTEQDVRALTKVDGINFRNIVADNVTVAANMTAHDYNRFNGFCMSNVTIKLSPQPQQEPWFCKYILGNFSNVTPKPCGNLKDSDSMVCGYPSNKLPIDTIQLKICSV